MKIFFASILIIGIHMSGLAQIKPGSTGPEIALPNQDGQLISLKQLRGKVVLIDFWASWCAPCRRNNPKLAKLYAAWRSQGFEILGISLDEDSGSWKKAIQDDKLEWLQVVDKKGWESAAADAYHVDAIPASFLLDKHGTIVKINPEGRMLESEIKSLVKKSD
jgi:peroxiredoxin